MDWKAYKQAAALPFEVLDCQVAVEKTVEGSRGDHRIDVWIQAQQYGVKTCCIIDCRHWDTPVTKAEVMALKQVMKDVKGDRALMLSNAGFDSGATKAARSTSITLTTLEAIQETAELELTRTTLISLENRITKLKQSLERLSESVQVASGIWQSLPKPGVDAGWVAKTTEALEAIKFGFAKARLQQPPYFVQKDETSGQPLLVATIEEFVTQAVVLIEVAESKLKKQHRQVTRARMDAPPVEVATTESTDVEGEQPTEGDAKPKRSLHAAFFRRKTSTPPVNFDKGDVAGRSRGDRSDRDGSRQSGRGGQQDRAPRGRSAQDRSFKGRKEQGNAFRPGPSEPGPARARSSSVPRFQNKREKSSFNPSPSYSPKPASGEKPKLNGESSPRSDIAPTRSYDSAPKARPSSSPAPRLKTGGSERRAPGRDSFNKPQRDNREPRFTPRESAGEPTMEGRWWDQPESREPSGSRPQQRSGRSSGSSAPRPRLSGGKPRRGGGKLGAPKLGGQKFAGQSYGAKSYGAKSYSAKPYGAKTFTPKPGGGANKKFIPKPALRGGSAGSTETYSTGERYRQAKRFGERPSGGKFSDRKFGDRKFSGERKFAGGRSSRPSFKGGGFQGGKFGGRKPGTGGGSPASKPVLRRQADSQPVSQPQGERE